VSVLIRASCACELSNDSLPPFLPPPPPPSCLSVSPASLSPCLPSPVIIIRTRQLLSIKPNISTRLSPPLGPAGHSSPLTLHTRVWGGARKRMKRDRMGELASPVTLGTRRAGWRSIRFVMTAATCLSNFGPATSTRSLSPPPPAPPLG
jgi:hypothetical protein